MSERKRLPKIEFQPPDAIEIIGTRRHINEVAVTHLATSMATIGLRVPISVRLVPDQEDPDGIGGHFVLISGAHRLAAAKKLGWEEIECVVYRDESEDNARLWEIAENLHRAELTATERAENIAEWVRLTEKVSAHIAPKPHGGRPEGGVRAAARELGIERTDVQRAIKIASLSPEAKAVAVELDLDNNKRALLTAAKQPPEKQADRVRELAQTKLGPVAPPAPKISPELAAALKHKKGTLTAWMRQHADDGIPALMVAFAANIEIIERLTS
jgi:hypothetical protein